MRQAASYESNGEGAVHPALTDGTFLRACCGKLGRIMETYLGGAV